VYVRQAADRGVQSPFGQWAVANGAALPIVSYINACHRCPLQNWSHISFAFVSYT